MFELSPESWTVQLCGSFFMPQIIIHDDRGDD